MAPHSLASGESKPGSEEPLVQIQNEKVEGGCLLWLLLPSCIHRGGQRFISSVIQRSVWVGEGEKRKEKTSGTQAPATKQISDLGTIRECLIKAKNLPRQPYGHCGRNIPLLVTMPSTG